LRWFTPNFEIDLCGHATLASAYVLFNFLNYRKQQIDFYSHLSGNLAVTKEAELLYLDFPSRPPTACEVPPSLLNGLSLPPQKVLKSCRDYFAIYETEEEIRKLQINYQNLRELDCVGIIVTAPGSNVDFVSRFFVPADPNIPEDPQGFSMSWKKLIKRA
jgi:predicted PhzF superfamily epimerase YddE/YHI9